MDKLPSSTRSSSSSSSSSSSFGMTRATKLFSLLASAAAIYFVLVLQIVDTRAFLSKKQMEVVQIVRTQERQDEQRQQQGDGTRRRFGC